MTVVDQLNGSCDKQAPMHLFTLHPKPWRLDIGWPPASQYSTVRFC